MKLKKLFFLIILLNLSYVIFAQNSTFDQDKYYRFTNGYMGDDKSLSLDSDGKSIVMAPSSNSVNQLWQLIHVSDSTYKITLLVNEQRKAIDVINDGKNNKMHLVTNGNTSGQSWTFTNYGNGYFRLVNGWQKGLSLDCDSDKKGTIATLNSTGQYSGQFWKIVETDLPKTPETLTGRVKTISPGNYYQIFSKASGLALDVSGSSLSGGAEVIQYQQTGNNNQLYRLEEFGDGYYMIVAQHSQLALDVAGVSRSSSAKLIQWTPTGNLNQVFKLEDKGDGYFQLIAAHSSKALEVNGTSNEAIKQEKLSNSDNQLFGFVYSKTVPAEEAFVFEDIPDMPDEDVAAIMKWIKASATAAKTPYCYRDSYGRTAGNVDGYCPQDNMEKDKTGGPGGLCYPKCKASYDGVGPVCWQSCPSGFRDDGAFCAKPSSYGRGAGRVPDVKCPKGYKQRGVGSAAWCDNRATWPWDLKTKSATISCKSSEQKNGGLCYPKCKSGFHAVGCCVCSPDCPSGFGADIGVSCTKKSYGRGAGKLSDCRPGQERDGLLCYPKCKSGYHGEGPVCWQDCGPGFVNCGAGCARSSEDCAMTSFDQVISVAVVAANIATLGLSSAPTKGATAGVQTMKVGSKTISSSTKSGKAFIKASKLLSSTAPDVKNLTVIKRVKFVTTGTKLAQAKTAYKVSSNVYNAANEFKTAFSEEFSELTSPEINKKIDDNFDPATALYLKQIWASIQFDEMAKTYNIQMASDALAVISIVDITGVTGVVSAYFKPTCEEVVAWPKLSKNYRPIPTKFGDYPLRR